MVTLKIIPPLTEPFGSSKTIELKKHIIDNELMSSLLLRLAKSASPWKEIFDPTGSALQSGIHVVVNGKLVLHEEIYNMKVKNGDKIVLSPVVTGG
jgi:molybdopterin converting factor small subunit